MLLKSCQRVQFYGLELHVIATFYRFIQVDVVEFEFNVGHSLHHVSVDFWSGRF